MQGQRTGEVAQLRLEFGATRLGDGAARLDKEANHFLRLSQVIYFEPKPGDDGAIQLLEDLRRITDGGRGKGGGFNPVFE